MYEVLSLIKELAEFEKAPDEVYVTVTDLVRDGFSERPDFNTLVAEINGKIVGLAFFFIGYSTWKGKMVFIDDLIVQEVWRKKGIGASLLDAVIEFAGKINASVIKWQVLNWNKPAIDFYKRYDVAFDDEWVDCKMYKKQINLYLQKKKSFS